ncbi:hypothetical protein [Methylomonas albis]|uniref:Peptidase M12A domain-containing protein n=1 Tax=Methylomonas albis TaxID=1854563 RepID=A0ABR9D0W3_9GAMM|nr:M12 family metallopeptidase [Methylomonas albis]MBD9356757.1 hypothetical protein [Methylomonas albis]CAD6879907.1 hypothetical protein [Methylomonas albis]
MGFATSDLDTRWPHARVPYLIDETQFPPGQTAYAGILNAINYYRCVTGIQFVPRIDEDDFVLIKRVADRSNSPVGRDGGTQILNCAVNDIGFNFTSKTTYAETSDDGPALACDGSNYFMVWRGTDDRLNVALLAGPGGAIVAKATLRQKTSSRPAVATIGGVLVIAYRETGSDKLRLISSENIAPPAVPMRFVQLLRVTLAAPWQTTEGAPALCVHQGALFVGWRGAGNPRLNIARVRVRQLRVLATLPDTSESGPALVSFDSLLYLAWHGGDNRLNLMRSGDGGVSFADKFISPLLADASPALVALNSELYIAWKYGESLSIGKVQTAPGALVPVNFVWQQSTLGAENTDAAPALAAAGASGCIAWKGVGNRNLNCEPTQFNRESSLIHESAHALGMYHEQQRPDRDVYVQVIGPEDKEWKENYKPLEDESMLGPYDGSSLMHYPPNARLQPRPGGLPTFGPGPLLSPGDIDALRYMYPVTQVWVLGETTDAQPALSFEDGSLRLAWVGSGNQNLNSAFVVMQFETFSGLTVANQPIPDRVRIATGGIENKQTYADTADLGPTLGGSKLIWKGSDNEDLNFAYISGGPVLADKTRLGGAGNPELSDHSPAAVPFGPYTAIAWKGHGNDSLNLSIVDSNGRAVSGTYRFVNENTETAPALTLHGGVLFMAWKGSGNNALNVAPVQLAADQRILGMGTKTTLPVRCDENTGPSIASIRNRLVIAWKGEHNDYLHFMVSFDDGHSFSNLHASAEQSSHAPALATVDMNGNEALVVAWKGADNDSISLGMVDLAWTHAGAMYAALAVDAGGTLNLAWLDLGNDGGWQGPLRIGGARLAPGGNVTLFEQGDTVRTALSIGADGTLNVAWLELGGSWQGPIAVGGATLMAGAPVTVFQQAQTEFAALTVDRGGSMNVAWLDTTRSGWQGPLAFGSATLSPGAPVSVFRQDATTFSALTVDAAGMMNIAWLDTATPGWQGPLAFGTGHLSPGAAVTVFEQSGGVFSALTIAADGAMNVAWLDTASPGWHGPAPFGDRHLLAGAPVAVFRQGESTISALTVDRHGAMNVAWLDTTASGWQGPMPFGNAVLVPGAPVTAFRQSETVYAGLTVDAQGAMSIVWLDTAMPGWNGPVAIGEPRFPPGAPVSVFQQSENVITALAVDRNGTLCVAWLDVKRPGWRGPVTIGDARFRAPTPVATIRQHA